MTTAIFVMGHCVACKNLITFHPDFVPSLAVNGAREPLCRTCVKRWGEIHKKPVTIHPDAYDAKVEE